MTRTLSAYDLASLAHREMRRVTPNAALGELDEDDTTENLIAGTDTDALVAARLDVIEARQASHEAYLKAILKAVSTKG